MGQVDLRRFRGGGILGLAALVALGSACGTFIRATVEGAFPAPPGAWPWATFWINMIGSFVLGALLETLGRAGEDTGWRRLVRLGVGTGVIGGFTTYSTYVVETDKIVIVGNLPTAASYALVSVVMGVAAADVGMAAVSEAFRRLEPKGRVSQWD